MALLTALWAGALLLSAGAVAWMSALMVLRLAHHARAERRRADRGRVEASLVALLQGRCDLDRDLRPYSRRARLMAETLLDFLGIVAGHDRQIVLGALESLELPRTLRARLDRGSLAGRLVSLEALAAFPGPETDAALRRAADTGPPAVRLAALKSLHEMSRELPLGRVLRELETGGLRPSAVVGELVRTLVADAPHSAAGELGNGLLPEAVQVLIIDGLASAGDYGVAPTLIRVAGASPQAQVRAAALAALGKLMHPAAEPAVRAGLADPSWEVRAAAAEAAGSAHLDSLAGPLSTALADPVWRVRFTAASALARLGADGLRRLREAAAGTVPREAETAALVLAERGLAT